MKRFSTLFGTWFAWLTFWRKPAVPIPESVDTPAPETAKASRSIEPEPSEVAAIPAPKAGWFARLMQVFRRQHKAAPEQTEATDVTEETSTPKPSLMSRFRNKFRRQSVPEAPEETRDAVHHNGQKPARTTVSDNENTPEDAPKIGFFKRWFAKLCNKWVWIPCVGILLLSLIGSALWIVLHTTQEKEKLQVELRETKKQLKKQVALVKKPSALEIAPQPAADLAAATTTPTNSELNPATDSGDCLVTNKESVTKNLKNCIESFNSTASGTRHTDKRR